MFLAFMPVTIVAQSDPAIDELRKEIDALKTGQAAIQRELQDIKRLLQTRPVADALPREPVDISKDPIRGSANARVAIIEYSDYQCSFCRRYEMNTFPQIENDYLKTGKVQYVFRDLPLDIHKNAFKAAEAARCAGEQGKFWEMHDLLFENQAALAPSDLSRYAASLALDAPRFEQCLEAARYAPGTRKHISEANSAGLSGTPSFLIGIVQPNSTVKITKKIIGARPYNDFKTAIDELVAAATPAAR
jgi:protein-disulfide isomerase